MFDGFIERIYPYLLDVIDENRIALQRKKFFSLVGDIYEYEDFYVERLNAFLEWLLVDARIPELSMPILKYILEKDRLRFDSNMIEMAESMISSRRSMFLVMKKSSEFSILEDIFDSERFYVDNDFRIDRTEKRSLVESRVLRYRGRSQIVNTYLLYSSEHKKIIMKKLRTYMKSRNFIKDNFIGYSSAFYIRSARYRYIPIPRISESLEYLISGEKT